MIEKYLETHICVGIEQPIYLVEAFRIIGPTQRVL